MMRRAFTLIELLVVMGLMGFLGTAAVGSYRAMQRGMEERGVLQSVNTLLRAAYQRAQIDRQPTVVYFWNETLKSETDDENVVVVGRAVAVRRHGRFSAVAGNVLVDEFGDLDRIYPVMGSSSGGSEGGSGSGNGDKLFVYPMENVSSLAGGQLKRSSVLGAVVSRPESVLFLSGPKSDETSSEQIPAYGFQVTDAGGVSWKPGMAYGFEFITLTLPHGYIFGSNYQKTTDDPIASAGAMSFEVGVNTGNGMSQGGVNGSVSVSSLRQTGADFTAKSIGSVDRPDQEL